MPVTAKCFLDSAKSLLLIQNPSESDFRSIVSRAYYAAFHAAKAFAENTLAIDIDNIKGPTHCVLAESLTEYKCTDIARQKEIRLVGARLRIFHSLRVRADYKLQDTLLSKDAETQIKNSTELMLKVDLLSQNKAA